MPHPAAVGSPSTDTDGTVIPAVDTPISDAAQGTPPGEIKSGDAPEAGASDAKEAPQTTLDVVRQVLDAKAPAKESSTEATAKSEPPANETPEAKAERESAEERRFDGHPAWKRIKGQRDEARAQIQAFEPDVKSWRDFQDKKTKAGLSDQNVEELIEFGRLLRTDPKAALARMRQEIADLEVETGDALPDDLQDAVDAGEMTEERALELSKTRAEAARATRTIEERDASAAQAQAAEQAAKAQGELQKELREWTSEKTTSDPNFAQKQPLINDRVMAVIAANNRTGKLTFTPKEAREIMDQAHAYVTEFMRAQLPPRTEKKPPLNKGAASQPAAKPSGKRLTIDLINEGLSGTAS